MRIIVYTAIFGRIDRLWSVHPLARGDCQHVAFVDRPLPEVGLWDGKALIGGTSKTRAIPPIWEQCEVDPHFGLRRSARHYKAVPHRYLDADVFIWVDGNVRLLAAPEVIVDKYLGDADLAIFKHPDRGCLYVEAEFCAKIGKDDPMVLQQQVDRYKAAGMPAKWGLPETRCVIRRNTPQMRDLGDAWWAELEHYSVRDQVSIPFVCWRAGVRWKEIPGRCWPKNEHKHFYYIKHKT